MNRLPAHPINVSGEYLFVMKFRVFFNFISHFMIVMERPF